MEDSLTITRPVTRRSFFKLMGSGLAVIVSAKDVFSSSFISDATLAEDSIAAWIHVDEAGLIQVYTGKVEVGQNIRTSLTQIVAEELRVSMDAIRITMGDTQLTPYDRGTFGSLTTPNMSPILRKAAASLREMLIEMAADSWKTNVTSLTAKEGKVSHPNGTTITYRELTKGKKILKAVNQNVTLTPPEQWKVAGQSLPKVNGRDFVTGKHQYASDLQLPGMLVGKILRAPAYGATLTSVDTSKAKSMAGVTVVEDQNFVGVVGPDTQAVETALWEIKAQWKMKPQPSRATIFNFFREQAQTPRSEANVGNVDSVFQSATHVLSQTFQLDYIAHVPLEPRAAVAQWTGNNLTVWTGTQRPFGVQEELSELFKLPKEQIRVVMPDTGSGYGGKHSGDAALEAARLAKSTGKPVKVMWTREEEFKWAYFRPAGVIDVKSAVSEAGLLTAWEFHNYNSGPAGLRTPYEVPNQKIEFHPVDSPLRQGSYRALAATANVFARESQINDHAHMLKQDAVAFRMQNLKDPRLKNVLSATAEKFGWNKSAADSGQGIACAYEKGGYIGTAVEVRVVNGVAVIQRIVAAFECGKIINPRHLKSQISGSLVQGLGGALFESIDFTEGKIINASLANYRVPRFKDVPEIEIVLLDRPDINSTGAGEAPLVALAPAIRQALYQATGNRQNQLPMLPNG
ncbi:MAG: xanthine dehydrogenase family protein molybdopterin-binding subunit [Cyclobacteriaceae bacterium]|nr:xanthine dehydrogenase family protein molybdopterin-binding subunit [Cyclobacteriaceae bacterium]